MLKKKFITSLIAAIVITSMVVGVNINSKVKDNVKISNKVERRIGNNKTKSPKYVFYFIGDGLGAAQRQVAEYYLQDLKGKDKKLLINDMQVSGINTTHSLNTLITDSAAAGTALATGHKTNNGIISKLPNGKDVKTLVELAEKKGLSTGIVTTTRLTHATPATFVSHNISRNAENEIAEDYLDSGVEFFAGGGYRHFIPKSEEGSKREDEKNLLDEFKSKGYTIFKGEEQKNKFRQYSPKAKEKVFAVFTKSHLPYEVDRKQNDSIPSLAEMTKKGIDLLSKDKDGFFMMVEGGRIDHACHANDIAGSVYDTLAFDESVKKAYEFYKKHPKDTLIVVVGDHETGGMGLSLGKDNNFLKLNVLRDVKVSMEDTLQSVFEDKCKMKEEVYYEYIAQKLGIRNLSTEEKLELKKAMNIVKNKEEISKQVYGDYDPVAMATAHILSKRANLFWTTYSHTATQIPMSATGVSASSFGGYKDNTEIAQTMAEVLGFKLIPNK